MHGSETYYACVVQCFHNDHEQKWPRALFDQERLLHFSNLQTIQCIQVKLCWHMYVSVSMTTINEKTALGTLLYSLTVQEGDTHNACVLNITYIAYYARTQIASLESYCVAAIITLLAK